MPYARGARVELVNDSGIALTGATIEVSHAADPGVARDLDRGKIGYFHATHGSAASVPAKQDVPLLNATGRGVFYGVTQTMRGAQGQANPYDYEEGDERVYVDGIASPAWHGTGTEDFYESGWYFFAGHTVSRPLSGSPAFESARDGCVSLCTAVSRVMLPDAIAFSSSLRVGIEHGSVNIDPAGESWTSYWYGQENTALRQTDLVDAGDDTSRADHGYRAGGETRETLRGTFDGVAATAEFDRPVTAATGPVRFTLAVDPANRGVRLARLGDQGAAGQRAEVHVDGTPVGTWSQALSSSHARWLEDVFWLPPSVVAGKSSVTVEIRPAASAPAWSAARYRAISEVAAFDDTAAPGTVESVVARAARTNAIDLHWAPAKDDGVIAGYEIFASRRADVTPDRANLIGVATGPSYRHQGLGLGEPWYYVVRAVDSGGNAGEPSTVATASSGNELHIEAESLVPPAESTAGVIASAAPIASDTAYALMTSTVVGQQFTSTFSVPATGEYRLTTAWIADANRAVASVAIDGVAVGNPFDGFLPGGEAVVRAETGNVVLTAGRHRLTVTVTGRNALASGALVGIDRFDLTLLAPRLDR